MNKQCNILKNSVDIKGYTIPKNTVYYIDRDTIYFCEGIPKTYNGKPENIILHFIWYDSEMDAIGETTLKNYISEEVFRTWIALCKPRMVKPPKQVDYANLMKHDRRHKNGSGGARLINDAQINAPLKWQEVTEEAHWAFSGNASVVASNIR